MSISQAFAGKICYTNANSVVMYNYLVKSCYNKEIKYLCDIPYRFRYHQKMLVLVQYRYRYQDWCSPNS